MIAPDPHPVEVLDGVWPLFGQGARLSCPQEPHWHWDKDSTVFFHPYSRQYVLQTVVAFHWPDKNLMSLFYMDTPAP